MGAPTRGDWADTTWSIHDCVGDRDLSALVSAQNDHERFLGLICGFVAIYCVFVVIGVYVLSSLVCLFCYLLPEMMVPG